MSDKNTSIKDEAIAMQKIGAEFEKLGKESQARIIQWLSSIAGKAVTSMTEGYQGGGVVHDASDIKQFWQKKKPVNNYEKIAVLGYHLELIQKNGEFEMNDIIKLWEDTREVLPARQSIINAWKDVRAKYHYVTSATGSKKCRIAIRGQKLVEALPDAPKELKGTAKLKKKKKRKSR